MLSSLIKYFLRPCNLYGIRVEIAQEEHMAAFVATEHGPAGKIELPVIGIHVYDYLRSATGASHVFHSVPPNRKNPA